MLVPEFLIVVKLLIGVVLLVGVYFIFATIFQSVLFQRYRLHKNEAARRKSRLHSQEEERRLYRDELLGAVKDMRKESE